METAGTFECDCARLLEQARPIHLSTFGALYTVHNFFEGARGQGIDAERAFGKQQCCPFR